MSKNNRRVRPAKLIVFIAIFLATIAVIVFGLFSPTGSQIEPTWLGNPSREDGQVERALNVWDLQVFEGKIYLGGGSTVTNAGPIKVWAYDPKKNKFEHEYTVKEEAIEHFRVFNNELYIPAADPRKGDFTKFYRRKKGKWQRYGSQTVKLAHVRDLIATDKQEILMVGNSRKPNKPSGRGTAIATFGKSSLKIRSAGIENAPSEKGIVLVDYNWFFSVFRYKNQIYAINTLLRDADNYQGAIARYEPASKTFELDFDLYNDEFIPDSMIEAETMQGIEVIYRLWNPVEFQGHLVYPVRSYSVSPNSYEKAYMNTIGFFYKSDIGNSPQTLELPKGQGEDVLIIDDELYVLASERDRNHKFTTYVYKTDRLSEKTKWQHVVKFTDWNKARSFEYLDGTFYFGLGQDYGEGVHNSGDILSYRPQSK